VSYDVLILGASTRAAAFSALRCGLRPVCADYFADRDLAAICRVERVNAGGGRAFSRVADSLPPLPWFYTGGIENLPRVVGRISRRHGLWGAGPETLRAVRDPVRVFEVLQRSGIPAPRVRRDAHRLAPDGTWLAKPLASGGGRGIVPYRGQSGRPSKPCYFQERIDGPSFSALFIGDRTRARLVGVTRQWIGGPGGPFAYRGSVGPLAIARPLVGRLTLLGDQLTASFGLCGWFGVDFVVRDGIPWLVEINPRYTASIEIHELALGRSLLSEHRRACEGVAEPPIDADRAAGRAVPVVAKEILYADRPMAVPDLTTALVESDNLFAIREVADIPSPGTRFEPGQPVLTLVTAGSDVADCRARLAHLRRTWRRRLGLSPRGCALDAS
jgi:predicted ATP-grasp superfamily ATP-dependent carboligase